jgi:hypothetical protein
MKSHWHKLSATLQGTGPLETLRLVRKNLLHEFRWYLDGRFDRKHGTRTGGVIELDKLDIQSGNVAQGIYYEATPAAIFQQMLRSVKVDYSDFTYCDLGSGLGRTLLLASDYPFQAIIGVEFSEALNRQAQENIRTYRSSRQRCRNLESKCLDAADFPYPSRNLVVFMYNPFKADLMGRVLANLKRSLVDSPRKALLLYYNPLSGFVVESLNFLPHTRSIPLRFELSREIQRKAALYANFPC